MTNTKLTQSQLQAIKDLILNADVDRQYLLPKDYRYKSFEIQFDEQDGFNWLIHGKTMSSLLRFANDYFKTAIGCKRNLLRYLKLN